MPDHKFRATGNPRPVSFPAAGAVPEYPRVALLAHIGDEVVVGEADPLRQAGGAAGVRQDGHVLLRPDEHRLKPPLRVWRHGGTHWGGGARAAQGYPLWGHFGGVPPLWQDCTHTMGRGTA